jgi:uncharacterized protein YjeT (DUF2065 family)
MSELLIAIGLVFVIEGLTLAAFPGHTKRVLTSVLETPDGVLRLVGLLAALVGLGIVWRIRG